MNSADSVDPKKVQDRRLSLIINNLIMGLISVDNDCKIGLNNSSALNMLNTNTNLEGRKIGDVLNLKYTDGRKVNIEDLIKQNRRIERDDIILSADKQPDINLRLSILPVQSQYSDLNIGGTIIMMRDITKEKTLNEERDEFISVVSHELRTPVAIIEASISNLQFLLAKDTDKDTLGSNLDLAHKQILYLGQMVNDLSTLSRADRNLYMDDEYINITDFIKNMKAKYLADADSKHIKLIATTKVNQHDQILIPNMVIEEIMQNLISNAIKYTPDNGTVSIGADYLGETKKRVLFYVKDTGIGISKSDQAHIFEKFWRSEDYRTRKTSGTGLGLHVVDQLAKKANLTINVDSEFGKGSKFSFTLPVAS